MDFEKLNARRDAYFDMCQREMEGWFDYSERYKELHDTFINVSFKTLKDFLDTTIVSINVGGAYGSFHITCYGNDGVTYGVCYTDYKDDVKLSGWSPSPEWCYYETQEGIKEGMLQTVFAGRFYKDTNLIGLINKSSDG